MTISSTSPQQGTMTMQKPCQNGQLLHQQQYVRPDSPAPSSVKKSPLAMLVDACSNIGQELTKTSKSADISQLEGRKPRSTGSPLSNNSSKPNSPPPPYSQRIIGTSSLSARPKGEPQANKEQLSVAASLASQYQLMYQQLLYQSELEYLHKSKGSMAVPLTMNKASQELAKSAACNLCRMNPGYKGYCVHESNNSLNQMLAMLNPASAAAAVLSYGSKLASFQQPYMESALPTVYPRTAEQSNTTTNLSVDSRRTSASSITSNSPQRNGSPKETNTEQPMDLKIEKSKSPPTASTQLIECHWVGAEGYCGKRFPSQDNLMQHLKHHVATCPNVVVADDDNRPNTADRHQASKVSPSHKHISSATNPNGLLTVGSKHQSARFQPYSVSDRMIPSALLLGAPR